MNHNPHRRSAIVRGSGLTALALGILSQAIKPSAVLAATDAPAGDWNKAAFAAKDLKGVEAALGGKVAAKESADIVMKGPDIAENGAVVPIAVESKIPGTTLVAILVEKNPTTLAATFTFPEGTAPAVTSRIKMAETSMVYALVQAGETFHFASKEIKVTLGGCGG